MIIVSKEQQQKSLKEYGLEGYELNNRNEILKQLEEPLLEVTPLQEVSIEVMIIRNREVILILIILLVIVIFQ